MRRGRRVVVMTDGRGHNYGGAFPGAEIATVPAATFAGRGIFGRITALATIFAGVVAALMQFLQLRPRAVVGFGGYPSLPVMVAASIARIPAALHEQNAVLGRVNRLVAPRVTRIAASLPFARFAPAQQQIVFTGNPVRPAAAALRNSVYIPPDAGGAIRILVFGGSQGAHALSEFVPAAVALLPPELRYRVHVTQQARAEDLEMVNAAYHASGLNFDSSAFFSDLPERMAAAHLIIARSGASTLSELTVIGRPAILIPYPFAMDDHQAANAAVLEKAGAAWVMPQSSVSAEKLSTLLAGILSDPNALAQRAAAARSLGHPDAAQRLADLAEQLADRRK